MQDRPKYPAKKSIRRCIRWHVSLFIECQKDFQARFKVSLYDLKLISNALLCYKKHLLNKQEETKASEVHEIDQDLYQLILNIEREKAERIQAKQAQETLAA